MTTLVRERSKITSKGQTTVPKSVRQVLGVSYGGEIEYVVDEGGEVRLVGAEETELREGGRWLPSRRRGTPRGYEGRPY